LLVAMVFCSPLAVEISHGNNDDGDVSEENIALTALALAEVQTRTPAVPKLYEYTNEVDESITESRVAK
jgi:hypothetical protein